MWSEPDASNFKVRSESYKTNKVKCCSTNSVFRLIAVDLYEVAAATPHIFSLPQIQNRMNVASLRGEENGRASWLFVVNIMIPGPPFYSFVMFFEGNKVTLEVPHVLIFFMDLNYLFMLAE
jgi:hypothetical protein